MVFVSFAGDPNNSDFCDKTNNYCISSSRTKNSNIKTEPVNALEKYSNSLVSLFIQYMHTTESNIRNFKLVSKIKIEGWSY